MIAVGKTKCLHIGREAFEEVLGPLQDIINTDRAAREQVRSSSESEVVC